MNVGERGVRLAKRLDGADVAVALAVPGAFGDDAVLLGVAYLFARLPRLVCFTIVASRRS